VQRGRRARVREQRRQPLDRRPGSTGLLERPRAQQGAARALRTGLGQRQRPARLARSQQPADHPRAPLGADPRGPARQQPVHQRRHGRIPLPRPADLVGRPRQPPLDRRRRVRVDREGQRRITCLSGHVIELGPGQRRDPGSQHPPRRRDRPRQRMPVAREQIGRMGRARLAAPVGREHQPGLPRPELAVRRARRGRDRRGFGPHQPEAGTRRDRPHRGAWPPAGRGQQRLGPSPALLGRLHHGGEQLVERGPVPGDDAHDRDRAPRARAPTERRGQQIVDGQHEGDLRHRGRRRQDRRAASRQVGLPRPLRQLARPRRRLRQSDHRRHLGRPRDPGREPRAVLPAERRSEPVRRTDPRHRPLRPRLQALDQLLDHPPAPRTRRTRDRDQPRPPRPGQRPHQILEPRSAVRPVRRQPPGRRELGLAPRTRAAAQPVPKTSPIEAVPKTSPTLAARPVPETSPILGARPVPKTSPILTARPVSETSPTLAARPVPEASPTLAARPVPEASPTNPVPPPRDQSAQMQRQRAQVGEPRPRIRVEQVHQQGLEPGRQRHAGLRRQRRQPLHHRLGAAAQRVDDGGRLAPGHRAEQPPAQQRPEREDVPARPAAAREHLGREKTGCPAAQAADLPEVRQEDPARRGHQHIAGAEIPMVGAGLVDRLERVRDRGGLRQRPGHRHRAGPQRLPLDQPRDQPQVPGHVGQQLMDDRQVRRADPPQQPKRRTDLRSPGLRHVLQRHGSSSGVGVACAPGPPLRTLAEPLHATKASWQAPRQRRQHATEVDTSGTRIATLGWHPEEPVSSGRHPCGDNLSLRTGYQCSPSSITPCIPCPTVQPGPWPASSRNAFSR
jgi:hypothetical protein